MVGGFEGMVGVKFFLVGEGGVPKLRLYTYYLLCNRVTLHKTFFYITTRILLLERY